MRKRANGYLFFCFPPFSCLLVSLCSIPLIALFLPLYVCLYRSGPMPVSPLPTFFFYTVFIISALSQYLHSISRSIVPLIALHCVDTGNQWHHTYTNTRPEERRFSGSFSERDLNSPPHSLPRIGCVDINRRSIAAKTERATPRLNRARQGHAGTQGTEGRAGKSKLVVWICEFSSLSFEPGYPFYFLSLFLSFLSLILYLSLPPFPFPPLPRIAFILPLRFNLFYSLLHPQPHSPLLPTQRSLFIHTSLFCVKHTLTVTLTLVHCIQQRQSSKEE